MSYLKRYLSTDQIGGPLPSLEPHSKLSILIKTAFLFIHNFSFLLSPSSQRPFHYLVLSLSSEDNVRSQQQSCYWKHLAVSRLSSRDHQGFSEKLPGQKALSFKELLGNELTKRACQPVSNSYPLVKSVFNANQVLSSHIWTLHWLLGLII